MKEQILYYVMEQKELLSEKSLNSFWIERPAFEAVSLTVLIDWSYSAMVYCLYAMAGSLCNIKRRRTYGC